MSKVTNNDVKQPDPLLNVGGQQPATLSKPIFTLDESSETPLYSRNEAAQAAFKGSIVLQDPEAYEEIRDDLEMSGRSGRLNDFEKQMLNEQELGVAEAMRAYFANGPHTDQTIQDGLEAGRQMMNVANPARLDDTFTENVAGSAPELTEDPRRRRFLREQLPDIVAQRQAQAAAMDEIEQMRNMAIAEGDASFGSAALDFAGLLIPFAENDAVTRVANNVMKEFVGEDDRGVAKFFLDRIFTGERVKSVTDHLATLDPQDQVAAVRMIIDRIGTEGGPFLRHNDMMRLGAIDMLTRPTAEGFNLDRTVFNLVGVLDAVGVGVLAKRGLGVVKGVGRAPIDDIATTNPSALKDLASEVLDEVADETAAALGTSKGQILRTQLPQASDEALRTGPDDLIRQQLEQEKRAAGVVEDASQGGIVVGERGRTKVLDKVRERMDAVENAEVHVGKTVIVPQGNTGVAVKAVYGRNATHGFTDAFEAMEQAGDISRANNADIENVRVLRADVSTGRLVELQGEGATIERSVTDVRGTKAEGYAVKSADGDVMGDMNLITKDGDVILETIEVAEKFRGQGIGLGLHLHAINAARRAGKTMASSTLLSPGSVAVFKKLEDLGFTIEKNPNVKTLELPGANKGSLLSDDGRPVFRVTGVPGNMTQMRELVGDDLTKAVVNAEAGEYFVQVKTGHRYSGFDALWSGAQTTILSGLNGLFGRWTGDINSIFNKQAAQRAFVTEDIGQGVRQRLNKMLEEPFKGMKTAEKRAVMEMMLEGSREGKVYSYGELVSKFGVDGRVSDKVVAGYRAIINVNNALHRIADNKMRTLLQNKGMMTLSLGDYRTFARPIDDVDGAVDEIPVGTDGLYHVYDPETNKITKMNFDELDQLYARGGKVGRLNTEEFVGREGSEFVMSRGRSTGEYTGLPDSVLRYEPGYFSRIYKDGYFIDRIEMRTVNGIAKEHRNTIHASGTLREAERMALRLGDDSLESGEKGVRFESRRGRELDVVDRDAAEMAVKNFEGRLIYSRRGDRLQTTEMGEARIEDPINATQRAIGAVSNRALRGEWLQSMRKEFVEEFADELAKAGVPNPGVMSLNSLHDAVQRITTTQIPKRKLKEMKAQIGYVKQMDETAPAFSELWRGWMVNMAEWLEGVPVGRHLQPVALAARNTTPIDAARTAAFTMFLVGNPIRQAFLQSQQILFLSGLEPKYIFGGRMGKELVGLRYGLAKIDTDGWAEARRHIAKALGQSEDEVETLVKEFRSSGLTSNIDSHQFVAGNFEEMFGVGPSRTNAWGTAAVEKIKYPLRIAKRIGFDFGEINNLSMTWLVAQRRFKKANGRLPRTKDEWNAVGGEARQLALGMNKSGELKYQRGLASLATQFMSIQHKAFFAMLPRRAGGARFLTRAEKARVAMGQAVVFGSAGFGMQNVYDAYVKQYLDPNEMTDRADDILRGGVMDYGVNKILESVWNEDTDLSISANWAASSGPIVQVQQTLENMWDLNWEEVAFGASFSAGERINNTLSLMQSAWKQPDLSTEQRVMETLAIAPEIFSGYSNYAKTKAHLAISEASANMPGVHLTVQEALAKRWLGIGTNKEQDYFELIKTVKEIEEDIKSDAKVAHDAAYDLAKRFAVDENWDSRLFLRKLSQQMAIGNMGLEPMEVATRVQEFGRLAKQERRPGEDSLFELVGKILTRGGIDDLDRVRAEIARGAFSPEFKGQVFDMLDDMQTTFDIVGFDPVEFEETE